MNLTALKERASLYQQVRVFFSQRKVLEIETPALSQAGNTDPFIDSFSVNTPQGLRWLHTSPEYPMKRLLAAGSGDIYQVCKVWRRDERGSRHNPEFTLLEWYRVGFTYQQLMQEVAELLHTLIPHLQKPPRFYTYRDLFLETLDIDPHIAGEAELSVCAHAQGIHIDSKMDAQGWRDLLLTHCVEPQFPTDRLTFVHHYPASQSALAQLEQSQGQWVAQRFEAYLGGLELGNGYQEQTSAAQNRRILEQDAATRADGVPIDERFLAALETGLPECAGVAVGIDRVLMCRMQVDDIKQVIPFPWEVA
ncbi:EF-P lysine aminoacylase EpmA [Candidatus Thiothrix sp. Deng01]|uniref:EF-P lysine aminoacylase EpmA n=1 Tax=Candidatus Thiothrix phosphatis TaxID=3112415 RepID=A0ABU6CVS9_9GAMM|nr:EF-P lysine aminoacylase EpmA [Candidatus Thiothrix sp. Deng01]MEB4590163.1 EF-P lysine aminoacylase EpmA [Candidatus Thiothrix sp. Deng01]